MAAPSTGFTVKCSSIYALLLLDIVLNSIADHVDSNGDSRTYPVVLLGLSSRRLILLKTYTYLGPLQTESRYRSLSFCRTQLVVQILVFLTAILLFSGTFLFQVGLIGILAGQFRPVLLAMPLYLVVFLSYVCCKATLLLGPAALSQGELWSSPAFIAMSIFQKAASMAYYALVVHATLQIGDAKWYSEALWVKKLRSERLGVALTSSGTAAPQLLQPRM